MTTSGPGATNLITGLANAMMDSIPMVALTGQVPSSMIGNDAFPGGGHVGHHPTGHQAQLPWSSSVDELASVFAEAFYLCQTGRPRPGADRPAQGRDAHRVSPRAVAVPEVPGGLRGALRPPARGHGEKAMELFKPRPSGP